MTAPPTITHRLWIDYESDGLYQGSTPPNPMEFAAILLPYNSFDLEDALFSFNAIFHLPQHAAQAMNTFVIDMHTKNGLLLETQDDDLPTPSEVAELMCTLLRKNGVLRRQVQLAGAGIGPFDLPFMRDIMTPLYDYCHYQPFDVSAGRRYIEGVWGAELIDVQPESNHRAMDDVLLAIGLAKQDRENWEIAPYGTPTAQTQG